MDSLFSIDLFPTNLVASEVIEYFNTVHSSVDHLLTTLNVPNKSNESKLRDLIDMHNGLNMNITNSRRIINKSLNPDNYIDTRLIAKEIVTDNSLKSLEDQHGTIIQKIRQFHKDGVIIDESHNTSGKLMTTKKDFGLSYLSSRTRANDYIKQL